MRRAVLLDRDGTLIEDPGYLGDPAQAVVLPGAAEGLAALRRLGYLLVVVTNQSGVARGYYDDAAYRAVDRRVGELLGPFAASYACFCHTDGSALPWDRASAFRKPGAAMLERAADDLGLDLAACVMVGDAASDLGAARAAGVRAVLVRTGSGRDTEAALAAEGLAQVEVVDDLPALARLLAAEAVTA